MGRAIGSAAIVFMCGYLGCFLGESGCTRAVASAATGGIVYAMGKKQ